MGFKNAVIAPIASYFYKKKRAKIIEETFARQDAEGKPRDLEEVIIIGDEKLRNLGSWTYTFPIPKGLATQLYDLRFLSPITLAAFKNELDIVSRWMDLGLGGQR